MQAGEFGGEVMAEPQALALLRQTVDGFLEKSFDDVRVDPDGDFEVQRDGVTTWVQLRSLDADQTAVLVWSASVIGVEIDAELTEYLAAEANNLAFGQFELLEEPSRIHISHALLGEFLSRDELEVAVEAVAEASAHYGRIVKDRFGGLLPTDVRVFADPELLPGYDPDMTRTDAVDKTQLVEAALRFVGVLAGALAAVYAYRQTSSWLLVAYAAVVATSVIGRAAAHIATGSDRVRLALFFLVPPAVGTAGLFLAQALLGSWWPAVLLACVGWIVSRGITNAIFMRREGVPI